MALLPIKSGNGASAAAVVSANIARIIQVTIHHLVFADEELNLPASVVTMRVGVEPPGKRQAQLEESAKRPDGRCGATTTEPLQLPGVIPSTAGPVAVKRARATQYGATSSSERTAIESGERSLYATQPGHIGGERVDLAAKVEAQVTALIAAGHQRKPSGGQLRHDLAAPHFAGSLKTAREVAQ